MISGAWHNMSDTRLAGPVTGYQLVSVRGHHQFHRDGHLVVRLPTVHPRSHQFPHQLGAHGKRIHTYIFNDDVLNGYTTFWCSRVVALRQTMHLKHFYFFFYNVPRLELRGNHREIIILMAKTN